ncbi:MAG: hypothetical protein IT425_08845 [Pirellulales bacterium]|nr:hypothetical protein [Pirellulales bacterium]
MSCLGLDIGGANLKAAHRNGWAESLAFPLWKSPEKLASKLLELIAQAPPSDCLAVTMTGELCDCFASKAEGVRFILGEVVKPADGRHVFVYLTNGEFVSVDFASQKPMLAAASNWRAIAEFASRYAAGNLGLVVDIGSTTTDIIPIRDGQVAALGRTDTQRLACHELLYTGVGRTPLCAVVSTLPWRQASCPVAAEFFATTADAYILLGEIPEDPRATSAADGRPATRECSQRRLAKQICADLAEVEEADFLKMAEVIRNAQLDRVSQSLRQRMANFNHPPDWIVISGTGEFLARKAVESLWPSAFITSLTASLGNEVSKAAAAYAVACLLEPLQPSE